LLNISPVVFAKQKWHRQLCGNIFGLAEFPVKLLCMHLVNEVITVFYAVNTFNNFQQMAA
jgi:hypothetical protein